MVERTCGPRWDAMPADEQAIFARRGLSELMFDHWRRHPDSLLAREKLFTPMIYEEKERLG